MDNNEYQKLNSCIFFTLSKLSRAFDKYSKQSFINTGLSPSHAFLLHIVSKNSETNQKKIGELLNLDPSTVTRFVSKLKNLGLVTKDKKGKNVYIDITKKGKNLIPEIESSWKDVSNLITSSLGEDERIKYLEMSKKLLFSIKKEEDKNE